MMSRTNSWTSLIDFPDDSQVYAFAWTVSDCLRPRPSAHCAIRHRRDVRDTPVFVDIAVRKWGRMDAGDRTFALTLFWNLTAGIMAGSALAALFAIFNRRVSEEGA
jgi:hypothetical protein